MQMLKNWNPEQIPEKEDIKVRLSAARTRLYELQMALKEHKIPVIVLFEGWGASGKGSTISKVIKNIDLVSSKLRLCQHLQRKNFGNHFFTDISGKSRKRASLHSWIQDGWIRPVVNVWIKS